MQKRDVIRRVLRGERPPYVPWSMGFTQEAREKLQKHYGSADIEGPLGNHLLKLGSDIGFFTGGINSLSLGCPKRYPCLQMRDRCSHVFQQLSGSMKVGPVMKIVPVEPVATDGNDAANIVEVCVRSAFLNQRSLVMITSSAEGIVATAR